MLPLHVLLSVLLLVPFANGGNSPEVSVHHDLLRRDHHVADAARSDILRRMDMADRRLGRQNRRKATSVADENLGNTSAFSMPMNSGAYRGVGQYLARFLVGTPAQRFLLVVDTGSELTWVGCKSSEGRGFQRSFRPEKSRTFRRIGCSSEVCKSLPFSLTICPKPSNSCLYDYLYQQNSVQGSYARESATIILADGRRRAKLPGITVGCTGSFAGTSFGNYDGVLGLAYTQSSFSTVASSFFGGKFSYCLVDHLSPKNASSYLVFGGRNVSDEDVVVYDDDLRYAQLNVAKPPLDPFYTIDVFGISVGDELLRIPTAVWEADSGGGVVVDSGSSLTTLTEPAYKAVTSALAASLTHLPRIDVDPFEFCYNWTGAGEKSAAWMPELVLHIAGHGGKGLVRLSPPVKSYLIDVAENVKCIGFLSAEWPGSSTIGNILQQNHLWEYDILKGRLGFKPSSCERTRR